MRRLIAQVTGISSQRPFPVFSSRGARLRKPTSINSGQKVLFLSDSFTHYVEPRVEQAAFDLLTAAGIEIRVIPSMGAGAALLSKGFSDAARKHAKRLIENIERLDPRGEYAIVGLEPPEIYMLKNDMGILLPSMKEQLARLADRTWLLDEYLIRSEAG